MNNKKDDWSFKAARKISQTLGRFPVIGGALKKNLKKIKKAKGGIVKK